MHVHLPGDHRNHRLMFCNDDLVHCLSSSLEAMLWEALWFVGSLYVSISAFLQGNALCKRYVICLFNKRKGGRLPKACHSYVDTHTHICYYLKIYCKLIFFNFKKENALNCCQSLTDGIWLRGDIEKGN